MQVIPYPKTEVTIHVTYKTIEAFSILGMGVFGPATAMIRKRNLLQTALKGGRYGAIVGLVAGPVMTELALKNATVDSIWDRAYRLRYNRGQVRVDRMATWAVVGGAAAGAFLGRGLVDGALVGLVIGTISTGVYNNFILKS